MEEKYLLGNIIIELHNDEGLFYRIQPLTIYARFDGNDNPNQPVRVNVSAIGGVFRQYAINRGNIHAEYFFLRDNVHLYDHIRNEMNMGDGHDFGNGIYGNGANNGATRSIKLTLEEGANNYHEDGHGVAGRAVQNMIKLIVTLERHLPRENQVYFNE